jgi:hypothetical protein
MRLGSDLLGLKKKLAKLIFDNRLRGVLQRVFDPDSTTFYTELFVIGYPHHITTFQTDVVSSTAPAPIVAEFLELSDARLQWEESFVVKIVETGTCIVLYLGCSFALTATLQESRTGLPRARPAPAPVGSLSCCGSTPTSGGMLAISPRLLPASSRKLRVMPAIRDLPFLCPICKVDSARWRRQFFAAEPCERRHRYCKEQAGGAIRRGEAYPVLLPGF